MGHADPAIALLRRRSTTEDTAMKKSILAVCCATLMGLGTAVAQTSTAPAQDTNVVAGVSQPLNDEPTQRARAAGNQNRCSHLLHLLVTINVSDVSPR